MLIRTYGCINEASRETAITRSSIQRVLKGKYISAGGYLWSYSDTLRIDLRGFKQHPNFRNSALGRYTVGKRLKNLEKLTKRSPGTGSSDFEKGKLAVVRKMRRPEALRR
ncbi:hypothetical protein ACFOET_16080 [Parapedobacter deserti]|uniref:NUMOD1 domain-containing protein n=1 Tax=Parapedobacter deserti TaxID=1912957 RepID=A0ABV7JM30_9SPHI